MAWMEERKNYWEICETIGGTDSVSRVDANAMRVA